MNIADFMKKELAGANLYARLTQEGAILPTKIGSVVLSEQQRTTQHTVYDTVSSQVERALLNPFSQFNFRRLNADRNVVPEQKNHSSRQLRADGAGLTAIVHDLKSRVGAEHWLVDVDMLAALNAVFSPEVRYTHIECKEHINSGLGGPGAEHAGKTEIYLTTSDGKKYPVSQIGSGARIILLVAANLCFVSHLTKVGRPDSQKRADSTHIIALEELENNLHPEMQRRLYSYLESFVETGEYVIFMTTHSSVAIDYFRRKSNAQIVHVEHKDGESRATAATLSSGHNRLLDDLGNRASDMLQTNIVIWVEGPSDRIYFNKWIELATDGALKQGTHYQCVFYGGSIIARVSWDRDSQEKKDMVEALEVCRNAVVIADSDMHSDDDPLKANVDRAKDEITSANGYAWITGGKEVENYLSEGPCRLTPHEERHAEGDEVVK